MTTMKTTTTEPRFTLDQVLQAAREVVEEKGGWYVYPEVNCRYAVDGMPACIVGHVINRLDSLTFAHLAKLEARAASSEMADGLRPRGWLDPNFWGRDADRAMVAAQWRQDSRSTWGEALAAAENQGADADM